MKWEMLVVVVVAAAVVVVVVGCKGHRHRWKDRTIGKDQLKKDMPEMMDMSSEGKQRNKKQHKDQRNWGMGHTGLEDMWGTVRTGNTRDQGKVSVKGKGKETAESSFEHPE